MIVSRMVFGRNSFLMALDSLSLARMQRWCRPWRTGNSCCTYLEVLQWLQDSLISKCSKSIPTNRHGTNSITKGPLCRRLAHDLCTEKIRIRTSLTCFTSQVRCHCKESTLVLKSAPQTCTNLTLTPCVGSDLSASQNLRSLSVAVRTLPCPTVTIKYSSPEAWIMDRTCFLSSESCSRQLETGSSCAKPAKALLRLRQRISWNSILVAIQVRHLSSIF